MMASPIDAAFRVIKRYRHGDPPPYNNIPSGDFKPDEICDICGAQGAHDVSGTAGTSDRGIHHVCEKCQIEDFQNFLAHMEPPDDW